MGVHKSTFVSPLCSGVSGELILKCSSLFCEIDTIYTLPVLIILCVSISVYIFNYYIIIYTFKDLFY